MANWKRVSALINKSYLWQPTGSFSRDLRDIFIRFTAVLMPLLVAINWCIILVINLLPGNWSHYYPFKEVSSGCERVNFGFGYDRFVT